MARGKRNKKKAWVDDSSHGSYWNQPLSFPRSVKEEKLLRAHIFYKFACPKQSQAADCLSELLGFGEIAIQSCHFFIRLTIPRGSPKIKKTIAERYGAYM